MRLPTLGPTKRNLKSLSCETSRAGTAAAAAPSNAASAMSAGASFLVCTFSTRLQVLDRTQPYSIAVAVAIARQSRGESAVRIGILGSGLMGGKLGTLFARAGHDVVFSYARNEQKLKRLARGAGAGARAGTPAQAARQA